MRPKFAHFLQDSRYCLYELDQLPPAKTTLIKYAGEVLGPEDKKYADYLQDILFLCACIKCFEDYKEYYKIEFFPELGLGLRLAKRALRTYCGDIHPSGLYDGINKRYFTKLDDFAKDNHSDHLLILEKLKNFPQEVEKPDQLLVNDIWEDIDEFLVNPSDLFWLKGDSMKYIEGMRRRYLIIGLIKYLKNSKKASILQIQNELPIIMQALEKHFD
jgi:hypothetical protein